MGKQPIQREELVRRKLAESLPLEEEDIFKSSWVSIETPGKGPVITWGKGVFLFSPNSCREVKC